MCDHNQLEIALPPPGRHDPVVGEREREMREIERKKEEEERG